MVIMYLLFLVLSGVVAFKAWISVFSGQFCDGNPAYSPTALVMGTLFAVAMFFGLLYTVFKFNPFIKKVEILEKEANNLGKELFWTGKTVLCDCGYRFTVTREQSVKITKKVIPAYNCNWDEAEVFYLMPCPDCEREFEVKVSDIV